jgi:hypothetical protein
MASEEDPTIGTTPPPPSVGDEGSADPRTIDFVTFLQSLYLNALMALGEVENQETRRIEQNLDLARQSIDILAALREKTRGNLTAAEDEIFKEMVPQLQRLYVRKRR